MIFEYHHFDQKQKQKNKIGKTSGKENSTQFNFAVGVFPFFYAFFLSE